MNNYLSLVKFSHTIFALPFALIGYFLAISLPGYEFSFSKLFLVIICMVTARNAAMAFNRYLDKDIDATNPRTKLREIPNGIISERSAIMFVVGNILLFIVTTYFINQLCFLLSPIALAIILGYSFTKRFTVLCHYILGLGLALAPVGAYIAVTASFSATPIMYGLAVFFWVAGFDIIYALQDEDFDRNYDLKSIPQKIGRRRSLLVAVASHFISGFFLLWAAYSIYIDYGIGLFHLGGLFVFLGLLTYQHTLISTKDISRVNIAFFTTNGIASLVFGITVILDLIV